MLLYCVVPNIICLTGSCWHYIFTLSGGQMIMKKKLLYTIIISLIFSQGCRIQEEIIEVPENHFSEKEPTVLQDDSREQVVLGKKLNNPYSVTNMQLAKGSLSSKGIYITEDIKTSHLYIRFIPGTQEEYDMLIKDDNLDLYYTPLDYKILSGGSSFRDPDLPEGQPNALYCSVPVDQDLPDIKYEILEELYIPETSENSSRSSDNLTLLEDESFLLTGNANDSNRSSRSRWSPSGRITLYDPVSDENIGVPYVKVKARNWFKTRRDYTDFNGYFKTGSFRGDVCYSIVWESSNATIDVRTDSYGQAWYNGPNQKKSAWNKNFSSGSSYFYAKNLRAAMLAYQVMKSYRSDPIGRISICSNYGEKVPGKYPSNCAGYYKDRKIYTYSKYSNGNNIRYTSNLINIAHEMGHAMQDHMNKDHDEVALKIKEAYAVFIGYLTMRKYQNIDEFDYEMYNVTTRQSRKYREQDNPYIPLFVDLVDDYNQYSEDQSCYVDEVKNYDIKSLVNIAGDKSVKTMNDFATRVKNLPIPPGTTAYDRDALLNQYLNKHYIIREAFYKWNSRYWVHTNNYTKMHKGPYQNGGVRAFLTDDRLYTEIKDCGPSSNSIIAARYGLKLKPGKTYIVTFRASTNKNCSRIINVKAIAANYTDDGYGWISGTPYAQETVLLSDTMKTYSLQFSVPEATAYGTVTFEMGKFPQDKFSADVILDDFYLMEL